MGSPVKCHHVRPCDRSYQEEGKARPPCQGPRNKVGHHESMRYGYSANPRAK